MDRLMWLCLCSVIYFTQILETDGKALDPNTYLVQFGYMKAPSKETGSQQSAEAQIAALKKFQAMMSIPQTGKMDAKTQEIMNRPRCGIPDLNPDKTKQSDYPSKPSPYYAPGYKWKKKEVTWHLQKFTPDIPASSQRRIMYKALQKWADISGLSFREVSSGADLEIKFDKGNHGDGAGNSFDGPGGVLAHAFYPENGDTHFDEDEDWTENTPQGTNLEIVAAHEFGHALGLSHSNVEGALMAPYYAGYSEDWKLHSDDIKGIVSLYGPNTGTIPTPRPTRRPTPQRTSRPRPTPKPTTSPKPKGAPNKCKTKFDAIILSRDGKYYAFRGEYVFRIDYYGVTPGYPKRIRDLWKKGPKNTGGAVYSWRTRYTYFFKGRKIWKYNGYELVSGYPKFIRDKNYPSKPGAALAWRDGRIYMFMGDKFYEFDEINERMMPGYPKEVSRYWPGIPKNVEAAVWARYDRKTYFFKGKKYYKMDDTYRRIEPGYPKIKAGPWMGCGTNGRYTPR